MKRVFSILLVTYYSIGMLFLPLCDFSSLSSIPEMYRHCKATEDKDMGPIDFVTDHLINIDGLFDKHEAGDQQKPHSPPQSHHTAQTVFSLKPHYISYVITAFKEERVFTLRLQSFFKSNYFSEIFRPPIHA